MHIIAAFTTSEPPASPTGGNRYDLQLLKAWKGLAEISHATVRQRWFRLRCQGPVLLFFHRALFRRADVVFQCATTPLSSRWLIGLCRRFYPKLKHFGVIHHPQWFAHPEMMADERRFFNSFDALITISQHVYDHLRQAGVRPPIYLLLPGRTKMPDRTVAPAAPPLILWNGYLLAHKGAITLLDALPRLRNEQWQAHFVISSRPSEEVDQRFRAAWEALPEPLRARVQVSDRLPIGPFREQFFRAAIFCLPSLVEGYSISTAEAMSCGCAAVVPRTENFLELIGSDDYPGFYDPQDPADLARQLDRLLADAPLRESAAAWCLERSRHLPDWEQFDGLARDLLHQFAADICHDPLAPLPLEP